MLSVLIAGGTHGNEMTGIALYRYWQRENPSELQRENLRVQTLLANPEAVRLGRRYVDFDLNRSFTPQLLDPGNPTSSTDIQRAREINRLYGPRDSAEAPDLVIDLHNSTAHMGYCLIINQPAPMTRWIAAQLSEEFSPLHILVEPKLGAENPYLPSLGKMDITVEVGPQAHGTLNAELFFTTHRLILRILDLANLWASGQATHQPRRVTVFRQSAILDYPRHADGSPSAMIHPELWGKDFYPLHPGFPLFIDFQGKTRTWDAAHTVWPCFIGEAAYLEKNIAMLLLQKNEELW